MYQRKKRAPDPTEGSAALAQLYQPVLQRAESTPTKAAFPLRGDHNGRMAGQKSPKKQEKASAAEKAKSADRDWMTTEELAKKIGWREHTLRDALRGQALSGVHRTSFGYKIESGAADALAATLGPAPAKGNSSLRPKSA